MIAISKAGRQILNNRSWHWVVAPLYMVLVWITLKEYIQSGSVNFHAGLIALMVSAGLNKDRKGSVRFAWASLFAVALYWVIPVKTFMYASLVCGVLFFVESFAGRMNRVSLLLFAFMSPIFEYASLVFSFPIRLSITEKVGRLLTFAEPGARVEGNVIFLNGQEFSVDPACMGLHMLVMSMMAGVMLIAVYQKKYQRNISLVWIGALLLFIMGCNIVSNLIRILCLVYFAIMPSSVMHSITGSVCFILYIVLPALFITRYIVREHGAYPGKAIIKRGTMDYSRLLLLNLAVLLTISATAAMNIHRATQNAQPGEVSGVAGYKTAGMQDHVIKLENEKALIYIKPVIGFYSSDHNPMICWSGSGYVFQHVKEEAANGFNVYAAELENKNDRLYTCWWYDDGIHATIEQLSWRWDAFKNGRNYCIVNITASSRADLEQEVRKFRKEKIVNHFMN